MAWGRKALLMQLFLFLFFNLLLKIFPAELCWISPIALCDGWCISGYGNLNCFLIYLFIYLISFFFLLSHGHFEMLYPSSVLAWFLPSALSRLTQHPKSSFEETICFDLERNNTLSMPLLTVQWMLFYQYEKVLHLLLTLIGKIFTVCCRRWEILPERAATFHALHLIF